MARLIVTLVVILSLGAGDAPGPKPLVRAHAHNDYEHKRPLLDALEQGFCSVEADVYLVQGHLLVAHDPWDLKPERSLQALYLDPLKKRVDDNGGRVFRDGPVFTLMIDVKSDAASSYAALREALKPYTAMLTVYGKDKVLEEKAIRIVISGNRDRATMAAEETRLAALDGRMGDLDATAPAPAALVPWVSGDWARTFKWKGEGAMPEEEFKVLRGLVEKAHAQKRLIRFWGAPEGQAVWRVLFDAGVDLINTDDLAGLAKFLNGN